MSCACLAALIKALQPPWGLLPPINLPPIMAQLGTAAPGFASLTAGASASASLSALAKLSLPALPIPGATLAAMAGLAATAGQLQSGLGINVFSASAHAQISALMGLFNLLPFDALTLPDIGPLGSLCSTLLMVKASLGINLLAPGAAVALQASLNAMASAAVAVAIPGPTLGLLASYSAVANLAAAAGVGMNFGALGASLSAVASLQIPALSVSPLGLGKLLQYLAALAACKNLFGINPFAVGMTAQLGLALAPLQALASVTMSESLSAAAGAAMAAGSINLNANFSAIAKADLSALIGLKLPSLAPLSMVAAIAGPARGSTPCGGSCPIGI